MDKTTRRDLLHTVAPAGAAVALMAGAAGSLKAANATQSLTTVINSFVPSVGGFVGTLTGTGFQVVNGLLSATANLAGNVLNGTGGVAGAVTQAIAIPVAVSGSCQILSLTLGPLDLNLLGLVVHLNQVV